MKKLLVLFALGAMSCGGSPVQGRQVTVDASGFTYKAQPVSWDGTDTADWACTGQQAYVRFDGTALTQGSVLVTVLDGSNAKVFGPLRIEPGAPPQSQPTSQGPCPYSIRLDYNDVTGTVAISLSPGQ